MRPGDVVQLRANGEYVRIIQRYTAPGKDDQPEEFIEVEAGVRGSDRTVRLIVKEQELTTGAIR